MQAHSHNTICLNDYRMDLQPYNTEGIYGSAISSSAAFLKCLPIIGTLIKAFESFSKSQDSPNFLSLARLRSTQIYVDLEYLKPRFQMFKNLEEVGKGNVEKVFRNVEYYYNQIDLKILNLKVNFFMNLTSNLLSIALIISLVAFGIITGPIILFPLFLEGSILMGTILHFCETLSDVNEIFEKFKNMNTICVSYKQSWSIQ